MRCYRLPDRRRPPPARDEAAASGQGPEASGQGRAVNGPSAAGKAERGTATAELAVVLPALILLTVLCVWAVTAVAVHVRCLDAARGAARGLAREEPVPAVVSAAAARAPRGATVEVRRLGHDLVAVEVTARVVLPGPWSSAGPGVTVGGRAVSATEGAGP